MTTDSELRRFRQFWADELAAAALYRGLAELEADHHDMFLELASTEERHAAHWAQLLRDAGVELQPPRLPRRNRILLWLAARFGVRRILPTIIRAEHADRDRYRRVAQAPDAMAEEEAEHGRTLARTVTDSTGYGVALAESRHRVSAGGSLRAAVFGVNDGLVSNLALIMGIAGGVDNPATVVLAGVAGLVAGAGSMAAGEWISVQSQREFFERELAVEREELEHFPADEQRELELIYRAKGVDEDTARTLAERIMADPETALSTLAREELGLDPDALGSPWVAAGSSFLAFALGAFVPLLPFLITLGTTALVASALLSGVALAAVGAAISLVTGRSALRSAARMVAVAGLAAAATYGVGSLVGVAVS